MVWLLFSRLLSIVGQMVWQNTAAHIMMARKQGAGMIREGGDTKREMGEGTKGESEHLHG